MQRPMRQQARGRESLSPGVSDSREKGASMELLYTHCAGIDVHQNSLSVCVLRPGPTATATPHSEIRQFGTKTGDLLALADWLEQMQVTHVAMESTGVYFALSSALIGRVEVPPALG
jgi:hypothetical protein